MGHQRSLARNHRYRKMNVEFDGTVEDGRVRTRFDGKDALSRVQNVNTMFRKSKNS